MNKIKVFWLKVLSKLKSNYQLSLILALSSLLNFSNLDIEGYANEYYAAGVKSMTINLKNFFFVAFDPSGFVSIDKPPVGFWIQTISAKIFGFSGWSIILPQALAGVISVCLLYYIVNRSFGKAAALIASLCLSITPIFVAASRNNTIDNLLVLTSLIACLFALIASERGSLKFLLMSLALVGIGFNIKMLEAYMILPALYITYLNALSISLKKRLKHLALGTLVLSICSFSWAIIVDLIPAQNRPFVGSSTNNTVTELIAGHNGAERLNFAIKMTSNNRNTSNMLPNTKPTSVDNNGKNYQVNSFDEKITTNGSSGLLRLFSENNLSDQISWLLPLAILGLISSILNQKLKKYTNSRRKLDIILWGMCLVPEFIYFSYIKSIGHAYYLTMMSPSISALVGIGIISMWELYKDGGIKSWLLPLSLIINGAIQLLILSYYKSYSIIKELMLSIGVLCFLSSLILIACIFIRKYKFNNLNTKHLAIRKMLLITAFIGILVTPSFWSFTTVVYRMSGGSPAAGLRLVNNKNHVVTIKDWFLPSKSTNNVTTEKLMAFLSSHESGKKYMLAVEKANDVADLIVKTGDPVMAIGGFSGRDKILTLDEFKNMVKSGEIRYALLRYDEKENKEIVDWIRKNGKRISLNGSLEPPDVNKSNSKDDADNQASTLIYELDEVSNL